MTPIVAGVDPGLRACGLGIVHALTGEVLRARLVKSPEQNDDAADAWCAMALALQQAITDDADEYGFSRHPELLLVERMVIRPFQGKNGKMGNHNPTSILGLAAVGGAIMATVRCTRKVAVYPSVWKAGGPKGSTNKKEHNEATWKALTETEKARTLGCQLSTGNNILDAIAMAKWGSFRFRSQLR